MRIKWATVYLLCICMAWVALQGGCTCTQKIVIPGLDGTISQSDGGRESLLDQADTPSKETPTLERPLPPAERPIPDNAPPELRPEVSPDAVAFACPNPADVACITCTATLVANEAVVLLHKHYLLTQAKPQNETQGTYKLYDLTKGCSATPFAWSGITSLQALHSDPDTTKVLLLGYGTGPTGQSPPLHLAFFDLAQPAKPLRELLLPKGTFRGAAITGLELYPRRGVFKFTQPTNAAELYIHYQMDGPHLDKVDFSTNEPVFPRGVQDSFFVEHEVYALQGKTRGQFPLAVWSVKQRKIVQVIARTNAGLPRSVFASAQDVFILEQDPKDRSKYFLLAYPIGGGAPSTLPAPGCLSMTGVPGSKLLLCVGKATLHRFDLSTKTALSPVTLKSDQQWIDFYANSAYAIGTGTPRRLWKVDLRAVTPTLTLLPDLPLPGARLIKPNFPPPRAKLNSPGPPYRIWQEPGKEQQRLGLSDLLQDTLMTLAESLPLPLIMGRETEFWHFYPKSFAYQLESKEGSSLYLVRNDTGAIFHREATKASLWHYNGGVYVSPGTQWLQALGHTTYVQGAPEKHELLLVHHRRYLTQKLLLERAYRVHHSDTFMVLGPASSKDPRRLPVYRVAQ